MLPPSGGASPAADAQCDQSDRRGAPGPGTLRPPTVDRVILSPWLRQFVAVARAGPSAGGRSPDGNLAAPGASSPGSVGVQSPRPRPLQQDLRVHEIPG